MGRHILPSVTINFLELLKPDTEWNNHRCARMRCKHYFYIILFSSWHDNWHMPLFFLGMNWCDSVGKKYPLNGRRSLLYGNNLNGWCCSIVLIWIWLTQSIVAHSAMTFTVTKKQNWKVLCNLHADYMHNLSTWWQGSILYVSQQLLCPKYGLQCFFQTKQIVFFTKYA